MNASSVVVAATFETPSVEYSQLMPMLIVFGVAIAGVLVIGAVASGYFVSRQGRRVLKEAIAGRRRTRLEDRVLDALWGDEAIGR